MNENWWWIEIGYAIGKAAKLELQWATPGRGTHYRLVGLKRGVPYKTALGEFTLTDAEAAHCSLSGYRQWVWNHVEEALGPLQLDRYWDAQEVG